MDWNWPSYLLGALTTVAVAILTGFSAEAIKDLYAIVKRKINPPEPNPIKVAPDFEPDGYPPGTFAWVNEVHVIDRLRNGYSYYRDSHDGAKRYRHPNPNSPHPDKEFFMFKADTSAPDDSD